MTYLHGEEAKKNFFCFIPMKISHKLCVRMDGTQFLIFWWFTAKNERGNDIIAWVYVVSNLFALTTHKKRKSKICWFRKALKWLLLQFLCHPLFSVGMRRTYCNLKYENLSCRQKRLTAEFSTKFLEDV